jgi:hypothetical protein
MTDWERVGAVGFSVLGGASLVGALLVVVAGLRRSGRPSSSAPSGSRWPAVLAACGALLFTFLSVQGEFSVIGIGPAILFAWAAAKAVPEVGAVGRDARALALLAAIAWAAASVAQFATAEWSKTVHGAIRVDLLLTGPLLAVSTYLALRSRSDVRAAAARTGSGRM